MKEYIEREAVLAYPIRKDHYDREHGNEHFIFGIESVIEFVENLPAADVAQVRHGRWVDENKNPVPWDECNSKCPSHSAYCSECGEWLTASDEYPVTGLYCPNCGALMDEKEDEHEAG